jgi:hypothetical protein
VRPRLLLCAILGVAAPAPLWCLLASATTRAELPSPAPIAPALQFQGTSSCSSTSCHNAEGSGTFGREYAVALERGPLGAKDRHAQAYDVLFNARSLDIERNLRGLSSFDEVHPESNVLCLRCHVMPQVVEASRISKRIDGVRQFRFEDGVSCEACHGAAEHWLAGHFRPGASRHGMTDTASLEQRVRLCIDCHVGKPGMEVDHDLLAAGHPRLNFEFSSFHFLLHKHWDYAKDLDRQADFEARGWAVGQVAAAQASLELLAARARTDGAAWPELSAYDCYACHHDLKEKSWRQKPAVDGRGILVFSDWYYAQLEPALRALRGQVDDELPKLVQKLRAEMQKPRPDRATVRRHAEQAAGILGRVQPTSRPLPVDRAFRDVLSAESKTLDTWDGAAQTYLGLSALSRTGQRQGVGLPAADLWPLRERLLFSKEIDARRDLDPAAFRSQVEHLKQKVKAP